MMDARPRISPDERPVAGAATVSIFALDVDAETRAAGRQQAYWCEFCDAIVRPVFVTKSKPKRKLSPRSYFKVFPPEFHRSGCPHRREVVDTLTTATGSTGARELRHSAPARFDDSDPVDKTTSSVPLEETQGARVGGTKGAVRVPGSGPAHSKSTTRRVRDMAIPWHHAPDATNKDPIEIGGCPAVTYEGAFRVIGPALGAPIQPARCVYYASRPAVRELSSGFDLRFEARARDGRFFNAFVPKEFGDHSLPKAVRDALTAASSGREVTVYILAGFRLSNTGKAWTLEPAAARHVWVEPGRPAFASNEGADD